jgi:uncharacterized Zn-binding protein involved in type VI secretion
MPGQARLGDRTIGICSAHTVPITVGGTIVTASTDTFVNNRGVARLGDLVQTDCGHTSLIVTASTDSLANNRGVARLSDAVASGPYVATIITASTDTSAN